MRCAAPAAVAALFAVAGAMCTRAPVLGPGARVAARGDSTCVLESGHVRCCGQGWEGELGNGALEDEGQLVDVAGIDDATSISAGSFHACAVRRDGSVWCWGNNGSSQLGYFSAERANPRAHATGTLDGVATQVSAGILHSCARMRDGTARCWGANAMGQLGTGRPSESPSQTPVRVEGLSDVLQIAAGDFFTCALLADKSVRCWGANEHGQLGDGSTERRLAPTPVTGVADAVEVSAGANVACARLASGRVVCWGQDLKGSRAKSVEGVEDAVQIAAMEGDLTCARRRVGPPLCWSAGSTPTIARSPAAEAPVTDLAVGTDHLCVIDERGTLRCTGSDTRGQLCVGSRPPRSKSFPPAG